MDAYDPLRFRAAPELTGPQVAERAGLTVEFAKRIFRALGLPEVPDDAVEFAEQDVRVLETLQTILSQGYSEEEVVEVARTYGYGLSRIAGAQVRLFRKTFMDPLALEGTPDEEIARRVAHVLPGLTDLLSEQLDHVYRRHLGLAMQQLASANVSGPSEVIAAGFVDLVDFSGLSGSLEGDDLGELVSRFETVALETCVESGAHVVKMIGDAVMFTASDGGTALTAGLRLVAAAKDDPKLPEARAGLDFGEVVSLAGDFYGRPVNVAARLTAFARPGTTVASSELVEALPQPADSSHIGRQRLKGVGTVRAFKINAYPGETPPEK
jgi:adenylate cyclase